MSVDGGATWTKVGTTGEGTNWYNGSGDAWEGSATSDSSAGTWVTANHILTGAAGHADVRVRFAFSSDGSVSYEGIGIDDVSISNDLIDLTVASVDTSDSVCASAAQPITVTVQNVGVTRVPSFDVSYTVVGSGSTVTETVSRPLLPGATLRHTFTTLADLSTPGLHVVRATVTNARDTVPGDDSITKVVSAVPTYHLASGPYSEDFEAGDGGWTTGGMSSTWAWGTPAGSFITAAASGTGAWVTNLTGSYDNDEQSWVESPCFDMSGLSGDPTLSFSHIYDTESCCDEGWIRGLPRRRRHLDEARRHGRGHPLVRLVLGLLERQLGRKRSLADGVPRAHGHGGLHAGAHPPRPAQRPKRHQRRLRPRRRVHHSLTLTMTVRDVVQIGHPVLRRPARPVAADELASPATQGFIDDLIETMRHARGAGLAANQVAEPVRICAIEVGDNPRYPYKPPIPLTVLVNPEIEPLTEETFDNYEGCLSVPDLRGVVARPVGVRVRARDRHGAPIDREVWGLSAGTFQHEVDHLDGTLFVDRVEDTRTLCTWNEFERHYRAAFIERVEALVARFGT